MSELQERVQFETRCSPAFKQKLVELAYLSGYVKKLKIEDSNDPDLLVDVGSVSADLRYALLKSKPGVSEMLMSINKSGALKLRASDRSELRDVLRKFKAINSNISQIIDLTEGQAFDYKDKHYDLSKLASEFFMVKTAVGECVDKILKKGVEIEVTSGPIFDAKYAVQSDYDYPKTLTETLALKTNVETRDRLKEGKRIKLNLKTMVENAVIYRSSAPVNDPLVIRALEIYRTLNENILAAHALIKKTGMNIQVQQRLWSDLSKRKNELTILVKDMTTQLQEKAKHD